MRVLDATLLLMAGLVGLGVQRTIRIGKMPLRLALEGQAMVVHPNDYGPRWNIRFSITPVFPKLIQNPLF